MGGGRVDLRPAQINQSCGRLISKMPNQTRAMPAKEAKNEALGDVWCFGHRREMSSCQMPEQGARV